MTQQSCRSCSATELVEILDLGFSPPSNAFLELSELTNPEQYFPLRLLFCQRCKLAQTQDFHTSETLFPKTYPYLSSASATWRKHTEQLVETLVKDLRLGKNSLVAEIASNDGYLLQYLVAIGIPCFGIEPTQIAAEISKSKGHEVYKAFLTRELAKSITLEKGYSDVVIANNVFAHVPELLEFTEAAKELLTPTGTLVLEIQYFPKLVSSLAFDTIYHEHFSYFSLTSMCNLFFKCGLTIFHAEQIPTHGGSLRVFARKAKSKDTIPLNVQNILNEESVVTSLESLFSFKNRVLQKRDEVRKFILQLKGTGQQIVGMGAAAKGNTLLNYCGITVDDISMIFDSAPSKHGKYTPGSHIPIRPLDVHSVEEFNHILVLPWNLVDEFTKLLSKSGVSKGKTLHTLIPLVKEFRI